MLFLMGNNYKRGRAKEYRIVNQLKTQHQIVQRTAGSHSPIDIIAIDTKGKRIRLIQSKLGEFSERNKKKILEENQNLNGNYEVSFEVR